MSEAEPERPASSTTAAASAAHSILVVDDEESMRHFLRRGLRRLGHQVDAAEDGEQAIARWAQQRFDLAIVDLKMPGVDGLGVLSRLRSQDPRAVVLLMSGYGTIATAVEAMKLGAADFVTKPFELDELVLRIDRALEHRQALEENLNLRRMLTDSGEHVGLVGQSTAMRGLYQQLELLRESQATVLITGESGTGKGLIAKAVHLMSDRARGPFVQVHCPAIPDTLLESELFGHEAGAFTGARQSKLGLIAKAHRGTVFLDEISEMSLAAQGKLERFLEEHEFLPLGATDPVRVDVRVVAASNRDLPAAVRDGKFRGGLLWRLDVVRLHAPPLRERRDDVPLLVMHELRRLVERGACTPKSVTADAMADLAAYDWPGNVRELQNVVERMAVMSGPQPVLGVGDLPEEFRGRAPRTEASGEYAAAIEQFDRAWFAGLLARTGGNITLAAEQAGLSRGHLHRRIRALGLDPESYR